MTTSMDSYGLNLFVYCGNNPVMYTDPDGHLLEVALGIIGGIKVATGIAAAAVAAVGALWAAGEMAEAISDVQIGTISPSNPFKKQNPIAKFSLDDIIERDKDVLFPTLPKKQAIFTPNPYDFNPHNLERVIYVEIGSGKNGGIIKWEIPGTNQAVFEWNEDYKYGSHYHVMPFGSNKHTGVHYWPGSIVPEPYNSLYFGW